MKGTPLNCRLSSLAESKGGHADVPLGRGHRLPDRTNPEDLEVRPLG